MPARKRAGYYTPTPKGQKSLQVAPTAPARFVNTPMPGRTRPLPPQREPTKFANYVPTAEPQFDMSQYTKEPGQAGVMENLQQFMEDIGSQPGYEMPDYAAEYASGKAGLEAKAGAQARQIAAKSAARGGGFGGFEAIGQAANGGELARSEIDLANTMAMKEREDIKIQMQDRQAQEALMLQTLVAQGKITGEQALLALEQSKFEDKQKMDGLNMIGDVLANLQSQYGPLSTSEMDSFWALATKAYEAWLAGDKDAFIKAGFDTFLLKGTKWHQAVNIPTQGDAAEPVGGSYKTVTLPKGTTED